jgi:hemoglobin/transferrin/lactoferrin receptor protein
MSRIAPAAAWLCLLSLPATAQTPASASAQPATPPAPAIDLSPVSITATRGPKPIDEIPATISIIDQQQLERQNATSPRDVVRYEPGVTVGNQPARGGQTNYTIRGIGGNRVLILQDGLRVQDFPGTNQGAGNFTRDFVDIDGVKRVEIVRGPASALYGSDALGGVVNYISKDPADLLDRTGRNAAFVGKFGYDGADSSIYETVTGAARSGPVDALLSYTRRDGHEMDNRGSARANPQTYQSDNLLARFVYHATPVDTVRLTGEYLQRRMSTDVQSELTSTIRNSGGLDTTSRWRIGTEYDRQAPIGFIDTLTAKFQFSRLDRKELSDQLRAATATAARPTIRRQSDFRSTQDLIEGDLQMTSRGTALGAEHLFTYGINVASTATSRPRDRTETNLTTGVVTRTVAGETFPNKNFPDTDVTQYGVYLQDQMTWGRLEVTPALRIDGYQLSPHNDADFVRSSSGLVVKSLSEVAVSPKLGAIYRLDDRYSVYAQYASGFRAPPYDSTNFGFTNRAFGYQILPNANLKSETSDGGEMGFRGRFGSDASFQVSGFFNHYNNFIDTKVVGTAGGLQQFQYVNLSSVNIWGMEARGEWRFARGFTWRGSVAWARGEDSSTGRPVDSVDPVKMVNGVGWQNESGFGVDAILTTALRHDRVSDNSYFKTPGYAVLDLTTHWDVRENITLNAGIYNVANQKYFVSQDVNGVASSIGRRDIYSAPGRYFAANLSVRW